MLPSRRFADRDRPGRMRVLFVTPWCLLDSTNGGAVSMRLLLRELARTGVECAAVNDALFTDVAAIGVRSLRAMLRRQGLESSRRRLGGVEHVEARDGQVAYAIADPTARLRPQSSQQETETFLSLVRRKLAETSPDIVLTWARDDSEPVIHALARKQGAAVVANVLTTDFPLAREMIAGAALVLTSSRDCASVLAKRDGVAARVLYPIVPRSRVATSRRGARHVTFVNPVPQKGLTVFLRIAERAQHLLPDARFLVVEGRWTGPVVEEVAVSLEAFPNIRVMPSQADVRRIYARTRVLLFPSLWRESFGMMIVEAQANGIPVIASRRGGIPEALGGAGVLIDPPARCVRDFSLIPNAREVRPWLAALDRLLHDRTAYRRAAEQARRSARAFEADRIIPVARGYLDQVLPRSRRKRV
jgi:glycosyltransferase involved in cell wall biosynthesis